MDSELLLMDNLGAIQRSSSCMEVKVIVKFEDNLVHVKKDCIQDISSQC